MLDYLDVVFTCKNDFISKLGDIYKDDDDFGNLELLIPSQLKGLLERLKDNIWFVIEHPYVDRHYRDTYYTFFSSKFKKIGRNCIRVHLFEGKITEKELLDKTNNINDRYRGFFIIRPLTHHILGRSLISPEALLSNNFVCCLTRGRVSLLGNNLTVFGFPHIAQDTETHTCAESALWSCIEYFGSKYPQYKPLLPSKIIKTLLDSTEHRILPSIGLTEKELAKCLNDNGFQCQIYDNVSASETVLFFRLLRTYVESGIPLLLFLANESDAHAVLVIGHEMDESLYNTEKYFNQKLEELWLDTSYIDKNMVFIDDNWPPYQIANISKPTAHYNKEMTDMSISSFIVTLPAHVFLVAEKVYDLVNEIFNDPDVGLRASEEKWITRLLLTGSQSFKNFLSKLDDKMAAEIKNPLLYLSLPKFIWLCELYRADNFTPKGHCSGLLIIDATSNGKSLTPVLFYAKDDKLFDHDGGAWKKGEDIVPFKMCIYYNNLRGEWRNARMEYPVKREVS
jgi:hypothetical protein